MKIIQLMLATALVTSACAAEKSTSHFRDTDGQNPHTGTRFVVGKFEATYFNDQAEVAKQVVDRVAIKYSYDQFKDIPSDKFHGQWTGNIDVLDVEQSINFNFNLSWSDVAFKLDDALVESWANSSKTISKKLSPGKHSISVTYANHWHTTNFSMSITPDLHRTMETVRKDVAKLMAPDTRVIVFGAYESGNTDNSINVVLSGKSTPVFLVLTSYSAVQWRLENPNKVPIAGVIVNSYAPGSTVSIDSFTPQFDVEDLHYEYENFSKVVKDVQTIFDKDPAATIGAYSPKILRM